MLIARWTIDAKFGHKPAVVESLKNWYRDIGSQIGWTDGKYRILTGSIGALESTIVSEVSVESLAELNAAWDKLAEVGAHKEWSLNLEPHVVSGTQRWEVFRVLT